MGIENGYNDIRFYYCREKDYEIKIKIQIGNRKKEKDKMSKRE